MMLEYKYQMLRECHWWKILWNSNVFRLIDVAIEDIKIVLDFHLQFFIFVLITSKNSKKSLMVSFVFFEGLGEHLELAENLLF